MLSRIERRPVALLLLVAIPIIIYANSLKNDFFFDDYPKIVENPDIRTLKGVFIDGPARSEPRIVSNFTLYLNYKLSGYNVESYRIINLLFHIANCVLIYFIALLTLRRVGGNNEYLAFLIALVFASHPINTEPLNYVIHGRFIMLCTLFYLLGFLLFILAFEGLGNALFYFAGCLVSYILSVFSKEVGITLPAVLFFYYLYFICDSRKKFLKAIISFASVFALVIVYAIWIGIPAILKTHIPQWAASPFVALMVEFLTQLNVAVAYLKLYIMPLPSFLNVDHFIQYIPYAPNFSAFYLNTETILSIIVIAGLASLIIVTYKKHRLISFSLLYLFITHSPTTLARKGELMAEYKNYLPLVGFAFLAALLLDKIIRKKALTIITAAIICLLFSYAVIQRNKVWLNDLTIWSDCAQKVPDNSRAYLGIGAYYLQNNEVDKSLNECLIALQSKPTTILDTLSAYLQLGTCYYLKNDADKAEYYLLKGTALNVPENEKGELFATLAVVYKQKKDYAKAIPFFERAANIMPYDASVYLNLGITYTEMKDERKAKEYFDKAFELDPYYTANYLYKTVAPASSRR